MELLLNVKSAAPGAWILIDWFGHVVVDPDGQDGKCSPNGSWRVSPASNFILLWKRLSEED